MQALTSAVAGGALQKLERLGLSENTIGDGGMQALASAVANGALPRLTWLDLRHNKIGEVNTFTTAIRSGALAALKTLYIHDNALSDAAKEELKAACKARGINASL